MLGNKKMSTFMLEKHSVLDTIKLVKFISTCDENIEKNNPNVVLPELLRIEQIPISFELESEYFTFLRDKNANAIDVRFTFKRNNNASSETDVIDMKFLLSEKGWDVYAQSSSDYPWLFNTLIRITKNIICDHEPGCIRFPITWGKIKN